uniref:Macro domain-containing protein n=1 Tax=Periophthalmus magnuspinnatus TaxID=409849 RepID=A0A3B3ZSV1_9GOBI
METSLRQTLYQKSYIILGVDLASNPGLRPHVAPEKRFEHILPSGVRVSVWKGDLANFSAEAVVNAANSQLHHAGGLALALAEAGGPQIQKESDDYVRTSGNVRTGGAVALGAGKLQCKAVIHAVGPQLYSLIHDRTSVFQALFTSVRDCLWNAVSSKHSSIAFPAIGTGNLGFKDTEVAQIMLHAVCDFAKSYPPPLNVHFVIFPSDVDRFKVPTPAEGATVTQMDCSCDTLLTESE